MERTSEKITTKQPPQTEEMETSAEVDSPLDRLRHDEYTIAIICPMGVKLAPVIAMLDQKHQDLPTS